MAVDSPAWTPVVLQISRMPATLFLSLILFAGSWTSSSFSASLSSLSPLLSPQAALRRPTASDHLLHGHRHGTSPQVSLSRDAPSDPCFVDQSETVLVYQHGSDRAARAMLHHMNVEYLPHRCDVRCRITNDLARPDVDVEYRGANGRNGRNGRRPRTEQTERAELKNSSLEGGRVRAGVHRRAMAFESMEGASYYPQLRDAAAWTVGDILMTTSFQSTIPMQYFSWHGYNGDGAWLMRPTPPYAARKKAIGKCCYSTRARTTW